MTAHRAAVAVVITCVALLAVLAAAPQQPIDASASVAREVRELRLSLERASAVSTQATIVALQVSAAQARMASVNVELANLRAQGGMLAAQAARMRRLVEEFEADFPDPSEDPTAMQRDPRYSQYQRAKASLGLSQAEEYFRPRENELVAILNREQGQLNELMMKPETLERSLKVVRQLHDERHALLAYAQDQRARIDQAEWATAGSLRGGSRAKAGGRQEARTPDLRVAKDKGEAPEDTEKKED